MTPPGRWTGEAGRSTPAQHPDINLGAYLLAALPPGEEAALEHHLLRCLPCQQSLAELSEVLPALGQVPWEAAGALIGEPSPSASLHATRSDALRARAAWAGARWRTAAAAGAAAAVAAVLIAIAFGSAGTIDRRAGRPAASASLASVSMVRVFPYTGDDTVTVRAWDTSDGGAEVTVQCHNDRTPPVVVDPGAAVYELWAVRDDGVGYKVSSWKSVYGDDTFPGRVDFPVDRIKSLELRSGGAVLSVVQ